MKGLFFKIIVIFKQNLSSKVIEYKNAKIDEKIQKKGIL
jgi:hypothetical protein